MTPPMTSRSLPTARQRTQLLAAIRAGATVRGAARDVGVALTTAFRWAHAAGIRLSETRAPERRQRVRRLRARGLSARSIAAIVGCDPKTVRRDLQVLRAHGGDRRQAA